MQDQSGNKVRKKYLVTNHEKGITYECILKRYPHGPFYIGSDVTGRGNRLHYSKARVDESMKFSVKEIT
jgi:hypothetical protein